jgi:hypothetical protein
MTVWPKRCEKRRSSFSDQYAVTQDSVDTLNHDVPAIRRECESVGAHATSHDSEFLASAIKPGVLKLASRAGSVNQDAIV